MFRCVEKRLSDYLLVCRIGESVQAFDLDCGLYCGQVWVDI
jgi:hypothetical protein